MSNRPWSRAFRKLHEEGDGQLKNLGLAFAWMLVAVASVAAPALASEMMDLGWSPFDAGRIQLAHRHTAGDHQGSTAQLCSIPQRDKVVGDRLWWSQCRLFFRPDQSRWSAS